MPWWFLSERERERGGGLTDPSVHPERDVEPEVMLVCEAFFEMEPCVDSLRWIFTGRALSEGRLLMIAPVESSVPTTAQVGQFIKFDEISFGHGDHTLGAAPLTRSCLGCMRRPGAPCSSAEHP